MNNDCDISCKLLIAIKNLVTINSELYQISSYYEDFLVMKETSSETISIPVSKINASQIRIEK